MAHQAKEWCAGLPLVHCRAMLPDEIQMLQQEAQRLKRRASVTRGLFFAVLLLIALLLFNTASNLKQTPGADLTLGMLFVAIVVLPLSLPFLYIVARDSRQRVQGLLQDLIAGHIKQFVGPPLVRSERPEATQQLLRARLLSENETEWRLEILPFSGRVWRVNDQPVINWMTLEVVEVAETPEFASIAAQWLEPVGKNAAGVLLGGQRDMSEAERAELKRYAHRQWTRFLPNTFIMTILLVLRVFALLRVEGRTNGFEWGWFVVVFLLSILSYLGLAFAYQSSRRMEEDALRGRVHIFRTEPAPENDDRAAESEKSEATVIEVLPVSQQRWTEDGRPAAWRMVQS